MKIGTVRTVGFTSDAITGAGKLDDQINVWCQDNGKEKQFIALYYQLSGAVYTALLVYTE